jgi:hypothetical protein
MKVADTGKWPVFLERPVGAGEDGILDTGRRGTGPVLDRATNKSVVYEGIQVVRVSEGVGLGIAPSPLLKICC